jgi:hypothetical protein
MRGQQFGKNVFAGDSGYKDCSANFAISHLRIDSPSQAVTVEHRERKQESNWRMLRYHWGFPRVPYGERSHPPKDYWCKFNAVCRIAKSRAEILMLVPYAPLL